jgi:soluble lytic murein transglycosylase-like protein
MGLVALAGAPPLGIVLSSAPAPTATANAGGLVQASSAQPESLPIHANLLELRPRAPLPSPTPKPTPTPTPAPTPTPTPTPAPQHTQSVVIPPVASGDVVSIIRAAAARWGVSGDWMVKIAECESGLRPNAVNPSGPYYGLFQFLMSTFTANGGTNIWDPADQANVTAKMLAHGQAWQWSCA